MGSIAQKICSRCGENKSVTEFHKQKSSKDGFGAWCKSCKHLRRSLDYQNNKQDQLEGSKLWRKLNPDKIINYRRREYYKDIKSSREKARLLQQAWVKKNPERNRNNWKTWQQNNKAKASHNSKMYIHRRKVAIGSFTFDEWSSLCKSYGNICLRCRRRNVKLTIDHIIPLSLGGTNNLDNIQPLCGSCNSAKGTKIIDYRR